MADLDTSPALTLRPASWAEVENRIMALGDQECSAEWYRREVADGGLCAVAVSAGAQIVGGLLHRTEVMDWGLELVIVAAAGDLPGVDLVAEVLPMIERAAMAAGYQSARFHTGRRGLGVKVEPIGYAGVETVYRKRFDDGRPDSGGSGQPSGTRDAPTRRVEVGPPESGGADHGR